MMSRASLSIEIVLVARSINLSMPKKQLYGSVAKFVGDFLEGKIETVVIIFSGYSIWILYSNKDPSPDPVPPPNECIS